MENKDNIFLLSKNDKDEYSLIINAKGYYKVITNSMINFACKEFGITSSDITNLELHGGEYENECFTGMVWNEKEQMRGTVKDGPEFDSAFSSLKNVNVSDIEELAPHMFTCIDSLNFLADDKLIRIPDECFAYTQVKNFYAPGYDGNLYDIASPHGNIDHFEDTTM